MSLDIIKIDTKERFVELYKGNQDLIKNNSPDYINEIREKAFEQFKKLGIPDKRNESYKYTDLNKEFDNSYKMYLSPKNIEFFF